MLLIALFFHSVFASTWSYDSQGSWPDFCRKTNQSPMNLDLDGASDISDKYLMKMVFLGATKARNITNTGNMIRVTADLGYVEIGPQTDKRVFLVKYLDFHTPSEHTLNGVSFPLEMQIVCIVQDKYWERDEKNMVIISVIFKKGVESFFFDTLEWSMLPEDPVTRFTNETSNINLREVVRSSEQYYFYKGSATNPDYDCRSDVFWYVIEEIKEAKEWQVNKITELFSSPNNRNLQTGNPKVYYSSSHLLVGLFSIIYLF